MFGATWWTFVFCMCCCPSLPSAGTTASISKGQDDESRCAGQACNPRMGNLALGRVLTTQSFCGSSGSEPYCFYSSVVPTGRESCSAARCSKCDAAIPDKAHLPSAMSDSSFRNPDTWWQSAEGVEEEVLQLDLESQFYFTHLILVFRSPRPAAMVLERSQDYGRSWKTLRYFARDCERFFGLTENTTVEENKGVTCTSKYSGAFPCTRGEVIYRTLSPSRSVDPYAPATLNQLMVTNLRVRLLQRQPCPCQAKHPGARALPMAHYAIYDFIIKGSCLCNGHAEHCVPTGSYRPNQQRTDNMVHGKCVCRHNTAGDHCERCAPLYNDQTWQAANGLLRTPHECKKCKCNGHAESCHFDRELWLASRRRSGGVCDGCRHNTAGRNCQNCNRGFYRDPSRPRSSQDSCKPCSCHPVGSLPSGGTALCNPINGECTCKPGVGGPHCDSCAMGYWGLNQYGCRPCDCIGNCDPYTGDCISGSDVEVFYTASGHTGHSGDKNVEELFSALHHSVKCKCVEMTLGSPKHFCSMEYDYVLMARVMSAHDRGSHAEVEVKVQKVFYQTTGLRIQKGGTTLYPQSWTTQGCTCPILNPGSEYIVAGHEDRKTGRLTINPKSLVKPWKSSLGQKLALILRRDCGRR
ncbi:netrin-4-like [Lampris incognitus]|uniref:netrin-4-like n=1 Tax=Lampris incognitus TaxID=2546036 RepID=UPI0024B53135|nr:netrin-4-like [Lampris incognitus]